MPWRRISRSILIGLVLLSWSAATPARTVACSCAEGAPAFDVVFVGRVAAVLDGKWVRKRLGRSGYLVGSAVGLLTVQLMWQGEERPFFTVVGGNTDPSCTLALAPGATYLVFGLERGDGPLVTNTCLGSRQMEDAPA